MYEVSWLILPRNGKPRNGPSRIWELARGLLAIAAEKLGADEVWGCDFDPFAVGVAKRNSERNGTPRIIFREQDVLKWKPRKKGYDVVLANIFSTVLIQAWPVIAKSLAPQGDLGRVGNSS